MSAVQYELVQNTISIVPVLLVDASGDPVPGVVKADITPYYVKHAGTSALLDSDDFDWTEIDDTNMLGFYWFTFNAAAVADGVLDTLGAFLLQLNRASGPAFVNYPALLSVVPMESWNALRHLMGLSKHNSKYTPTDYDAHGFVTEATLELFPTTDLDGTPFKTYSVLTFYNANGTLAGYNIAEAP